MNFDNVGIFDVGIIKRIYDVSKGGVLEVYAASWDVVKRSTRKRHMKKFRSKYLTKYGICVPGSNASKRADDYYQSLAYSKGLVYK